MEECEHIFQEVDNAGATALYKCIRCGQMTVTGNELCAKYPAIGPATIPIRKKVPVSRATWLIGLTVIGGLVALMVVSAILVAWEIFLKR